MGLGEPTVGGREPASTDGPPGVEVEDGVAFCRPMVAWVLRGSKSESAGVP
jgi:hypothetical protein